MARFVCSQPQYSALYRVPEREVFPLCARHGIGQVVWSPLAQGVLSGKYRRGEPPPGDARAAGSMGRFMGRLLRPKALDAVAALEPIAREAGLTMAQLALAWVLRSPYVTSAIVGATRPEQVLENAAAADVAPVRRRRRRGRRGARARRRALEQRLGRGRSGSIRQPPPGAGIACQSSSKPSSGAGRMSRRARAEHAAVRDPRAALARPRCGQRLDAATLDEVADDPEPGGARGLDVARPVGDRRVGVVDHERLPRRRHSSSSAASRARVRRRSIEIRTWVSSQRSR